ncbi:TetR/AcrR family transcriptional regulator [Rhizobium sp. S152]|uniref:TetR/AcrR family transcriptional regulator n=1 Tax=Rhizobium sp. S152 TaxID=3055038 RepID=UPI0025A9F254|nr:TetR/AcrR family transcriptional regulator [Rhizobium sp. S152]MDM9625310.1 TetR/AcrR family transcriptional regulator [Rhizobium sp. S152]
MKTNHTRPGGRPRKDQAAAIGERLLDGARAVFAKRGIGSASLDAIAADLGMSKHTLYRRYPNKGALLEAVVARDLGRFREALVQAAEARCEPLEALHAVALRYFTFGIARDYAAFYLAVMAEAAISTSIGEKLAAWSATALEPLEAVIVTAQAANVMRAGDPTAICAILVDLLEGASNRVRLAPTDTFDEAACRILFDERWDLFVAALSLR